MFSFKIIYVFCAADFIEYCTKSEQYCWDIQEYNINWVEQLVGVLPALSTSMQFSVYFTFRFFSENPFVDEKNRIESNIENTWILMPSIKFLGSLRILFIRKATLPKTSTGSFEEDDELLRTGGGGLNLQKKKFI